jgi:aspartate aminotransferase/aminotransferase
MHSTIARFRQRRDLLVAGLEGRYRLVRPGGAFYLFPQVPWGDGTEFVTRAIELGLLIIPGKVFSRRDTHFRISYAADRASLERGIELLLRLAAMG